MVGDLRSFGLYQRHGISGEILQCLRWVTGDPKRALYVHGTVHAPDTENQQVGLAPTPFTNVNINLNGTSLYLYGL